MVHELWASRRRDESGCANRSLAFQFLVFIRYQLVGFRGFFSTSLEKSDLCPTVLVSFSLLLDLVGGNGCTGSHPSII